MRLPDEMEQPCSFKVCMNMMKGEHEFVKKILANVFLTPFPIVRSTQVGKIMRKNGRLKTIKIFTFKIV